MTAVLVSVNLPQFERWIDDAARRQIPFATALALTRVAKAAREDIVGGLPSRFTIRSGKLAQSIRYKPADKREWPQPRSIVYSLAESLILQELGGTKRPRRGRDLAIPGAGTRPTPATRIPAGKKPRAVLSKRGYFIRRLTHGISAGQEAILQRVSRERYPLRVAYLLRPQGDVRARLGFADSSRKRVSASLAGEFIRAMEEAFRTARR